MYSSITCSWNKINVEPTLHSSPLFSPMCAGQHDVGTVRTSEIWEPWVFSCSLTLELTTWCECNTELNYVSSAKWNIQFNEGSKWRTLTVYKSLRNKWSSFDTSIQGKTSFSRWDFFGSSFYLRQKLKEALCPSVPLAKCCLEHLVFLYLAQVYHRSLKALSLCSHSHS